MLDLETRVSAAGSILIQLIKQSPATLMMNEYHQVLARQKAVKLAQAKGIDHTDALEWFISSVIELDNALAEMPMSEIRQLENKFVQTAIQEKLGENGYTEF